MIAVKVIDAKMNRDSYNQRSRKKSKPKYAFIGKIRFVVEYVKNFNFEMSMVDFAFFGVYALMGPYSLSALTDFRFLLNKLLALFIMTDFCFFIHRLACIVLFDEAPTP